MVKTRQKRFNWKARQSGHEVVAKEADPPKKSVANKIDIGVDETKYDSCNALVLDTTRKGSKTFRVSDALSSSSESDDTSDEDNDNSGDSDVKDADNAVVINDKTESKTSEPNVSDKSESDVKRDSNVVTEKPVENVCEPEKPKPEVTEEVVKRQFVAIDRTDEIEKFRSALPIVNEEHTIMDSVFNNMFVIVCGETGSGKTTQVPQFLYEAGFATNGQIIGVTEPRRVAAIAMSKRVAHEMNLSSSRVSYQIRFDTNATKETQIKFMTDGVLLKEIQNDFLLQKYSVIVIDEAHERSLYSDILIGLLSRIVPLRNKKKNPLKLIIMSATLRVEDFTTNTRLFKSVAPVLKIDSRQYPVSVHFNKKTNTDYLHEAFRKVCKIHAECPAGGVLVFVTGRLEVEVLCRRLRAKYPNNSYKNNNEVSTHKSRQKRIKKSSECEENKTLVTEKAPTINLDDYDVNPLESETVLDDFDYSDDENDEQIVDHNSDDEDNIYAQSQPLYCLPLYSMLPHSQVKTKVYDNVTGISTFIISWTSKASADQRAGRAGRTGPGHCYRLYSSAIFNDEFPQYSEPEILRKPSDDLMLQMKAINIENVVNFPFPSQPSVEALIAAEKRLISMGALRDMATKLEKNQLKAKITELGKAMSHFPISPRYAKMLALSRQHQLMPYTIAIVSALTIQEIFISNEATTKKHKFWFNTESTLLLGDVMVLLNSIGAAQYAGLTDKFCKQNGLRHKAITEINKLRKQLIYQIRSICSDLSEDMFSLEMKPPNALQIKLLRQIMLSGFFDRIARKVPVLDIDLNDKEKRKLRNAYQSIEVEKPVFMSKNSILSDDLPEYVVYQELFESSRLEMRNVVPIEAEWLPLFVPHLCTFSNPLENPAPRYDSTSDSIKCHRSATFGPYDWPIKATELVYPHFPTPWKPRRPVMTAHPTQSNATVRPLSGRTTGPSKPLNSYTQKASNDLLKEYTEWLPQSYHQEVRTRWSTIGSDRITS
ncbi:unnamed protein product [Oppiella nova]|uniref:RNA helicase n=1 Tax=Oppiella nova TaxID=334625 RepID=A0A7R9LNZ7_9ACAR|nr:unnamed protein product [Oppiella nova]CAG2165549.1 unnamed protein product [Oppiella nova]